MTSVYLAYHASGQLLYVGLSLAPLARFTEHMRSSEWWPIVQRIEIERYDTREQARERELQLIRTEQPPFNKVDNPRRVVTQRIPIPRKPGPADYLLDDLRELRRQRDLVDAEFDRQEAEVVALLRAKGHSWGRFGQELGVTRQSAWEQYGTKGGADDEG